MKRKIITGAELGIADRDVVVSGRLLRVAAIRDEEWVQGQPVEDPEKFLSRLTQRGAVADLFAFTRALPETERRYPHHVEMENAAVAPCADFKKWWDGLPQESRKNVRRSERRGVTVRRAVFDDALVAGISVIYNETPLRQGRKFWHYGKPLDRVKAENATYLDRGIFIGAYFEESLVGFIKMVRVNSVCRIMQILSLDAHVDKRPTNALLAKAVEFAHADGATHLVYGRYVYGNKENSPMTEFKRRNGFERLEYPRYFVPLTARGRLALAAGLHRGAARLLPEPVTNLLLTVRQSLYRRTLAKTAKESDSGNDVDKRERV